MRKLTKNDCQNAARKLSNIVFDKKIKEIDKQFRAIGDKLIETYIPKPLMALSNEYVNLFSDRGFVISVRSEKNFSQSIYVPTNIINPLGDRKVFLIHDNTYKALSTLCNEKRNSLNNKTKYEYDVAEALWTLRTKRKIEESFPEALPYLDFDDGKTNLPAPKYEELRNLLK